MPAKKFYKTIITVEVISEEPYVFNSLEDTARDIFDGDCSGHCEVIDTQVMNGKQAALALRRQGSDPEFFGIDDEGKPLE